MEFEQAVRARRSIRKFSTADVPEELVQSLVGCAVMAPSSMNGQPWRFIVVRSAKSKRLLAEIKDRYCPFDKQQYSAQFLREAPVLVITCVERAKSFDRGIENGVLATAHLLLAAANHGLASVYLSAYKSDTPAVAEEIRSILAIPGDFDPITVIPLGYPAEAAPPKTVKSAGEVIFNEAFGRK